MTEPDPFYEVNGLNLRSSTHDFIAMISEIKDRYPDCRIGQIISMALPGKSISDLYYLEDRDLVAAIRAVFCASKDQNGE